MAILLTTIDELALPLVEAHLLLLAHRLTAARRRHPLKVGKLLRKQHHHS